MLMNELQRQVYLQAMGIPVWLPRDSLLEEQQVQAPGNSDQHHLPKTFAVDSKPAAGIDWPGLAETVAACVKCELSATRTQTVFGVGNQNADWLFIGEAPGAEEDKQGEPFVGRAGQLLSAMLFALGLKRSDVYIANVLKCRPPNNRDPRSEEVSACESYLRAQIGLIKPKVIIALGRHAAHNLLKTGATLASLRGKQHDYHGTPLIVTYHPAYLLRTPGDKNKTWQDLCSAHELVQ